MRPAAIADSPTDSAPSDRTEGATLLSDVLQTLGVATCIIGVVVEFFAFACMGSFELRRRMPFQSPITILSWGCSAFFAGVLTLLAARWIR
jgi:hypothetical protein